MVPAKVWPLGPTWINHVKFVYTHPSLLFIDQGSIIASSNSKKDRFDRTGQQRLQRGTSAWNNLNVCEQPADSAGVMWMIRQLVYLSTRALEDCSPHGCLWSIMAADTASFPSMSPTLTTRWKMAVSQTLRMIAENERRGRVKVGRK